MSADMNIKIDKELRNLIPPLAPEELAQLEANLLADGCRDPLVVWLQPAPKPGDHKCYAHDESKCTLVEGDGVWTCTHCNHNPELLTHILIDGHNRYEICNRHGIAFDTEVMQFDSRAHARVWMRNNQRGRRNLTKAWEIELELGNKEDLATIGKAKMAESGAEGGRGNKKPLSQNDKPFIEPKHDTRKEIAKAAGTSTGMVGMAEQVKKRAPEVWEKAKAGEVTISAAYKEIKNKEKELQPIHQSPAIEPPVVHNHRAQGTGENEWYTPPKYIEMAKMVLGEIDLDPASSEIANRTVCAKKIFTIEDSGLQHPWFGRVWMNPPYSQPHILQFIEKLSSEYESGNVDEAIALTHNYTDTLWFHRAASACKAICFTRGRIGFLSPEGERAAPTQGQAFFYFGKNAEKFIKEFSFAGFVVEVRHG